MNFQQFIPNHNGLPYHTPDVTFQLSDISHRLTAVEKVCFEILYRVSNSASHPVHSVDEVIRVPVPMGAYPVASDACIEGVHSKSRAVNIVDPSEPQPKPLEEDAASNSSSVNSELKGPQHKCEICRNKCTTKWSKCRRCFRKDKRERNTVECSTLECASRISKENRSGLCHVCWEKSHPKCMFCPSRIRSSEQSSQTCQFCSRRFRSYNKFNSPKEAWTRSIQNGQIGKLFSRPVNGRFLPDIDQEEAHKLHDEYLEWCVLEKEDSFKNRDSARNRRLVVSRKQEENRENALAKFQSGQSVEFLPTPQQLVEEETALQKCVSDKKLITGDVPSGLLPQNPPANAIEMSAFHGLTGSCQIPANARKVNKEVLLAHEAVYESFPVSSGVKHKSMELSLECNDNKPLLSEGWRIHKPETELPSVLKTQFTNVDCRPRCVQSGCSYAGVCLDSEGFCLSHTGKSTITVPTEAVPVKTAPIIPQIAEPYLPSSFSGDDSSDDEFADTLSTEVRTEAVPVASKSVPVTKVITPEAVPVVSKKKDVPVTVPVKSEAVPVASKKKDVPATVPQPPRPQKDKFYYYPVRSTFGRFPQRKCAGCKKHCPAPSIQPWVITSESDFFCPPTYSNTDVVPSKFWVLCDYDFQLFAKEHSRESVSLLPFSQMP